MTVPLTTRVLPADAGAVAEAARVLAAGGLVAFPTETVYGLGADATAGRAVARIYEAKGRPAFNPLIATVVDRPAAQALARFNADAARLADAFWPGPLTLVLPKTADCAVAALATAGLDSIAVRVPDHAVARDILAAFGRPVVAPSANRSGHVSPTKAAHVQADLGGRIDLIIDGGATRVGVESTIIACLREPVLLRPGGLPRAAIERALGRKLADAPVRARRRRPARARHARRALCAAHAAAGSTPPASSRAKRCSPSARRRPPAPSAPRACSISPRAATSSKRRPICSRICARSTPPAPSAIAVMPIPHEGLGEAINDRLARAATQR